MEIKKIFGKKVALQLIANNNKLLYTEENHQKKWLSVFVFEETPKLMSELTTITSK
jgi:hypothetical protein